MSTIYPKTIELAGHGIQGEATVIGAAVTPGMLVTHVAGGIRPHNQAGKVANANFAVENDMVGRGIDDVYAVGENSIYRTYAAGSRVYALVAANAAEIADRDYLTSAGNGALEKAGDGDIVVAQALAALDNSGTGTMTRLKVEIVSPQVLNPASA